MEKAYFATGCFWHPQVVFDEIPGVKETIVGYSGGEAEAPTYEMVCGGNSGHYETIEIVYDPELVSYEELLDAFWKNIDPHDSGGQGPDRGQQYQAAIFYTNADQQNKAKASKDAIDDSENIAVTIRKVKNFYPAEDYHQKYMQKRYRGIV